MPRSANRRPIDDSSARRDSVAGTAETTDLAQRVLGVARRHFFAHGFRGVTMSDLARELGVSKKTLYVAFSSKEAVLRAILEQKVAAVDHELAAIAADSPTDPVLSIDRLLECVQRQTSEVTPQFLRDMRREQPALLEWLEMRRHDFVRAHFTRILREGKRAGEIREDVSIDLVIELILAGAHAITTNPRVAEIGLSVRNGFAPIIRIVLDGIRQPKRRRSR